ncbi:MAG: hypothetical protein ABIR47_17510 [Candidatus Kapaibacterium sp.]
MSDSTIEGYFREGWECLAGEDYVGAIKVVASHLKSDDQARRTEASKIAGLAYFSLGEYPKALKHLALVAEGSSDAGDWFNVLTSATMAGEIERGERAMAMAIKCQTDSGYTQQPSIPFIRLYYTHALCDVEEFERAFLQLQELAALYSSLGITDTHFLYTRGIPFLSNTMIAAARVFKGLGNAFDSAGWLERFAETLDVEGRVFVAEVRSELESL